MNIKTAKKWRRSCLVGLIIYLTTAAPTVKKNISEYYKLTNREAQIIALFIPIGSALLFRFSPRRQSTYQERSRLFQKHSRTPSQTSVNPKLIDNITTLLSKDFKKNIKATQTIKLS